MTEQPKNISLQELVRHALLLIVPLIVLFPGTFSHHEIISAGDQAAILAPWYEHVPGYVHTEGRNSLAIDGFIVFDVLYDLSAKAIHNGEWPLWNHLQYGGMPLLADGQSAVFYPPRLLHAFLNLYLASTLYILLKVWLCGMTAYLCARSLRLSVSACRFASLGWMMSSFTLIWCYHPVPDVAAWLPVLFMGVEFILDGRYRKGFYTTALGATLMLLAGHPETAFTMSFAVGVYFLLRLALRRPSFTVLSRTVLCAGGAWGLALGVTAAQTIPLVEYIFNSYDLVARGGGNAATHALPFPALIVFWAPRFFGVFAEGTWWADLGPAWEGLNSNWVNMIYPGLGVWLGVTLLRKKDLAVVEGERVVCLILTSCFVGLLAFSPSPLGFITGLPLFRATHHVYHMGFVMFALPLLGAIGWDRWFRRERNIRDAAIPACALAIVLIAAVLLALGLRDSMGVDGTGRYVATQIALSALFGVTGLAILVGSCLRRRPTFWFSVLTAVLVVDLFVPVFHLRPTIPRRYVLPETDLTNYLQELPQPVRVRTKTANIWEGMLQPYGIEQWVGYDGLYPARTVALEKELGESLWTTAEPLLSIPYYLNVEDNEAEFGAGTDDAFELIDTIDHVQVYRNHRALPRAFLVGSVEVMADSRAMFRAMKEDGFEPGRVVFVERPLPGRPLEASESDLGAAEVVERSSTKVTVDVAALDRSVLVLTDTYFPGWHAYADGEELEVFPVFHAFRGVVVPQGRYTVEFRYEPASFAWGLTISTGTLLGSAGLALLTLARNRRRRRFIAVDEAFLSVPRWALSFYEAHRHVLPLRRRRPLGGRWFVELALHGALLVVPLVILFPKTFSSGEMITAGDQLLTQPPWSHYGRETPAPRTNPLIFESLVTFNVNNVLTKQAIERGEWPLWNHLQHGGVPLLANGQSTPFYPLRLLHAVLDVHVATTLYILLKLWLCGMTAYLCARCLSLGIGASRFTSLAWMLCSYNLIWCYHPVPDVSAWFPLVFLGVEYIVSGRGRKGFFVLVPSAIIMLFAGHPETAFTLAFGAGVYFFLRLIWEKRKGREMWKAIGLMAAAWAIVLGVTAVQTLPLIEYISVSWNVVNRPHQPDTAFYLSPGTVAAFWAPRLFGTYAESNYWGPWVGLNSNFVGMIFPGLALWFAVTLLFARGKGRSALDGRAVCLFIAVLFSALLAFEAPVIHFVNMLPILSSTYQIYHIGFALFGLALLGGMGIDSWFKKERRLRDLRWTIAGAGVVCTVLVSFYFYYWHAIFDRDAAAHVHRELIIAGGFGLACLAVLALSCRWRLPRLWPAVLAVILAADLIAGVRGLRATVPREYLFKDTPLTGYLQDLPQPSRVGVSLSGIVPGYMQPYGIEQWQGYDGIYPERTMRFNEELGDHIWAGAESMKSMEYYLSLEGFTPPFPVEDPGRFDLVTTLDGVQVYRNNRALPRAYLVGATRVVPDVEDMFALMKGGDFDPARLALLENDVTGLPAPAGSSELGTAIVTERSAQRVVVEVDGASDAVLVLSDTFYPGWRALIDGEETEIFPVNYVFRGIVAPAGPHTVEFRYDPLSFRLGLGISTGTLILCAAASMYWLGIRPRDKKRGQRSLETSA